MYAQPITAPPSLQLPPNPRPRSIHRAQPPYEYAPGADREIPAFAGMTECIFSAFATVTGACAPSSFPHRHHVTPAPSSRHSHTVITSFPHPHHVIPAPPSRHSRTVITSFSHRHHVIPAKAGIWERRLDAEPPYIRQSSRAIGPGLSWRKVLYTSPVTCGCDSADASRSQSLAFHCQATYKSPSDRSTAVA